MSKRVFSRDGTALGVAAKVNSLSNPGAIVDEMFHDAVEKVERLLR